MNFTTECVVKELRKLKPLVEQRTPPEWENHQQATVREFYRRTITEGTRRIGETNDAGRTVFACARVAFESLFWFINANNKRVKTFQRIKPAETNMA
jgi:hypothetical protein